MHLTLPYNYLLLDAARAEGELYTAMDLNKNYRSLYKGIAEDDFQGVAPYLFSIKENTEFADWFFSKGRNQSWGVVFFSNASFDDVYNHFRRFLMVKTEDGQQLYFRFYDPRVLHIFLPTCDQFQLKELFGPVRHFIAEAEDEGRFHSFRIENAELQQKILDASLDGDRDNSTDAKNQINESATSAGEQNENNESAGKKKHKWNFTLE